MYQVIARKYRPQSFADVINQEHVKSTLENAIAQKRIAHGYIFSGQRGTGKTTVARILARCLNCIQGPTNKPCGVCASCLETAAGNAVDVIEIDAASNRGINEMRELRENVRYRPARDRYKVFIIDEAHQITSEAFNALLKTIEEPPEWAVFVLCTTESHKIPATIASRCQHFSFRSVDFEDLVKRIAWICEQEGITADQESLAVLAQAGEGSVRDSLSALDQAIACCGTTLRAEDVRALLGGFSLATLYEVTQALSESSPKRMLAVVDELERNGQNLQHFSRELARYFRNLLVAKVGEVKLIAASDEERGRLTAICSTFSEEDLTRYLQLSLDLFKDLQYSLQPRFHLELGLVRLVQAGRLIAIEEALASLEQPQPGQPKGTSTPPAPPKPAAPAPRPISGPSPFELDRAKKATKPEPQMSDGANALAAAPAASPEAIDWKSRLFSVLTELGMTFTADAVEHSAVVFASGELRFRTPKEFVIYMRADDLNKAIRQILGRTLKIKVMPGEESNTGAGSATTTTPAAPASEDDVTKRALENPEVKRYQELFGGQVRTVRNLKE
jgi:DNA polymerase III subunit gamma/tau